MSLFGLLKPDIEKLKVRRDIEGLIKAQSDDSEGLKAAEALASLGTQAIPALVAGLSQPNDNIRIRSSFALATIAETNVSAVYSPGYDAILKAFKDKDTTVRQNATYIVRLMADSRLGDARAIQPMLESLEDAEAEVRNNSARGIGILLKFIGDEQLSEKVVTGLLKRLDDTDADVRASTVASLALIGGNRSLEGFVRAAKDTDAEVRKAAIEALGKAGSREAVAALISLLGYPDSVVSQQAFVALYMIGKPVIQQAIAALGESDALTRIKLEELLVRFGPAVIEPMYEKLSDKNSKVQSSASTVLGHVQTVDDIHRMPIRPLLAALASEPEEVRIFAAKRLRDRLKVDRTGVQPAFDALLKALKDPNPTVREIACEILGDIGDDRVVIPLLEVLENNPHAVIEALTSIFEKAKHSPYKAVAVGPIISLLRKLSQKETGPYRENASEALDQQYWAAYASMYQRGEPDDSPAPIADSQSRDDLLSAKIGNLLVAIGKPAVEPLIQVLRYDDDKTRALAEKILGRIGDTGATDQLVDLLQDQNGKLRAVAVRLLDQMQWQPATAGQKIVFYMMTGQPDNLLSLGAPAISALTIDLRALDADLRALASDMLLRVAQRDPGLVRELATEALIAALQEEEATTHGNALLALSIIADDEVLDRLATALCKPGEKGSRGAAEALAIIGGSRAAERMIPLLSQCDRDICERALEVLVKIGDEAVDKLVNTLRDPDGAVRKLTVEVLGCIGSQKAVDSLIVTAIEDKDDEVRKAALIALGKTENPQVAQMFIDYYRENLGRHSNKEPLQWEIWVIDGLTLCLIDYTLPIRKFARAVILGLYTSGCLTAVSKQKILLKKTHLEGSHKDYHKHEDRRVDIEGSYSDCTSTHTDEKGEHVDSGEKGIRLPV